jgi:ribonuclease HI
MAAVSEPTNPGGAMGNGVIVRVDGETKLFHADYVKAAPGNTNNIAEYLALEKCIDFLLEEKLDADDIAIHGDSQLAIRQMIGEYGMNSGAYIPHAQRCLTKIASFRKPPKFVWIPREQNAEADNLSKKYLIENNIPIAKRGAETDVLMFGKYKGTPISAITDMSYLKWMLREAKVKPYLQAVIEKRISEYEHLAK